MQYPQYMSGPAAGYASSQHALYAAQGAPLIQQVALADVSLSSHSCLLTDDPNRGIVFADHDRTKQQYTGRGHANGGTNGAMISSLDLQAHSGSSSVGPQEEAIVVTSGGGSSSNSIANPTSATGTNGKSQQPQSSSSGQQSQVVPASSSSVSSSSSSTQPPSTTAGVPPPPPPVTSSSNSQAK